MSKKAIVHKEEITYFLRCLLDIAGQETEQGDGYEKRFAERLNFQNETEWKKYRAAIDLLDDTEYAIISAFEYQLGDLNNKNRDVNGMYLRLYGILNAVYLQMSAYQELVELLKFCNKYELKKIFKSLNIYKLRNIAGAHTLDFDSDKEILGNEKVTSFRIFQGDLDATGTYIKVLSQHGTFIQYELLSLLHEYEYSSRDLLIKLVKHALNNLVNDKEQRSDLIHQLEKKLKNLIDYTKIDKNKAVKEKAIKEQKNAAKKY